MAPKVAVAIKKRPAAAAAILKRPAAASSSGKATMKRPAAAATMKRPAAAATMKRPAGTMKRPAAADAVAVVEEGPWIIIGRTEAGNELGLYVGADARASNEVWMRMH